MPQSPTSAGAMPSSRALGSLCSTKRTEQTQSPEHLLVPKFSWSNFYPAERRAPAPQEAGRQGFPPPSPAPSPPPGTTRPQAPDPHPHPPPPAAPPGGPQTTEVTQLLKDCPAHCPQVRAPRTPHPLTRPVVAGVRGRILRHPALQGQREPSCRRDPQSAGGAVQPARS